MADYGYIKALLNGILDGRTRHAVDESFKHLMGNFRFGVPDHQTRATNGQMYWQQSTTASDTAEFSILHGLPNAPAYAIPVLELDKPGSKAGFLTVSKAADGKRIYLKADAGSTGVPFTVLIE